MKPITKGTPRKLHKWLVTWINHLGEIDHRLISRYATAKQFEEPPYRGAQIHPIEITLP